jgi:hypothetical protein
VDLVTTPGAPLPVEDASFDLVAASSVLEHDPVFWRTFVEMCRKTKPGGIIYINAPSNGAFHRYPEDHWRFYPDAGKALVRWAVSQGENVTLIESFVAPREADIWNDFVAVFRKGPSRKPPPKQLLHSKIAGCMNIQVGASPEMINYVPISEDMTLIETARAEAQRYNDISAGLEHSISQMQIELDRVSQAEAVACAKIDAYKSDFAQLQSAFLQRQEEIEQTSRAEAEARNQLAEINTQVGDLTTKLMVEREWTFRLAGERRVAEESSKRTAQAMNAAFRDLQKLSAQLAARDQSIQNLRAALWEERAKSGELDEIAKHKSVEAENEARDRRATTSALEEARTEAESEARARIAIAASLHDARDQIGLRSRETELLTQMLAHEQANSTWLRKVYAAQGRNAWWWGFMPQHWQAKQIQRRLARHGLFDSDRYLELNPDVAAAGADPLHHYIQHGMVERRNT